jgi:hypothetical protein
MKRPVLVLHCFLLLVSAAAYTAADDQEAPQSADYAWGFPILVDRAASFYSIELPLQVNQSVSDPDLRDAGVYNSAGAPVPRVFQQTDDDVDEAEHLVPLPAIPLYKNLQRSADDVKLLFEREGDKTRVEFNSDGLRQPESDEQLSAYIVDTRQLKHAIEALEFAWNPVDSGFIGRIIVDSSNNLQDWSEIGAGAVADLRENDASVVQRRVTVRKSSHDYLRVRWEGMPANWGLSRIQAFYVTGTTTIVRKTITLQSSGTDPQDGGRIFDLGGTPKIDRLRIVLTQPNTIVSATIYRWSERQQRWAQVASGSHHHIGRGDNVITSATIRVNKVRASRFKVVVTRGQPDAAMQLEIGWRPDTLIFLAQGEAPFILAAGRAADAEAHFPQDRMYGDRSIVGLSSANGRAAQATLGPRYALGGKQDFGGTRSVDWRQLSLWFGLILGVAFVGFMAIRVIRDLRSG